MDRQQNTMERHPSSTDQPPEKRRAATPQSSFAAKCFGYDIFLSFALGPPPRGTQSFASDLSRRLRELDFTVFFSEEEAAAGSKLKPTLSNALRRSRALVVVANAEMLADPGWVRTEVVEFHRTHPQRPIIPIFIDKPLKDTALAEKIREWLPYEGNIWIDDSGGSVKEGIVSKEAINRLATAPRYRKANSRWRWLASAVIAALLALLVGLGVATFVARQEQRKAEEATERAIDSKNRAEMAQRKETALRLNAESQAILSGTRSGGDVLGLLKLLAAHRIASHNEIEGTMLAQVLEFQRLDKITGTDIHGSSMAFSADGSKVVSGSEDGTLRLWPGPTVWMDLLCAKLTRNLSRKEWREQVLPDIDYIEQCPGLPIPPDETE